MEMRECNTCNKDLPLTSFSVSNTRDDGYQRICKSCNADYFRDRVDKDKRNQYYNERNKVRRKTDVWFRVSNQLRGRLRSALKLKGVVKTRRTHELLGCTVDDLVLHLERQLPFTAPGCALGDCHIDHIIPCAAYDLSNEADQKRCFNWRNLQPLTPHDNMAKHATLPSAAVLDQLQSTWPVAWLPVATVVSVGSPVANYLPVLSAIPLDP